MDFIIDLIAHRIGVFVLSLLSGGRFKGESGFAWGLGIRRRRADSAITIRSVHNLAHLYQWPVNSCLSWVDNCSSRQAPIGQEQTLWSEPREARKPK